MHWQWLITTKSICPDGGLRLLQFDAVDQVDLADQAGADVSVQRKILERIERSLSDARERWDNPDAEADDDQDQDQEQDQEEDELKEDEEVEGAIVSSASGGKAGAAKSGFTGPGGIAVVQVYTPFLFLAIVFSCSFPACKCTNAQGSASRIHGANDACESRW